MSDFGGKLRHAREGRGLSLRQIAASTKISVTVLEALERNDLTRLPGGIFSRAFVRTYALEVGLDPDETIREFLERTGDDPLLVATAPPVPGRDMPFEPPARARVLLTAAIAAAALLVVVAAAAWFGLRTWREHHRTAVVAAPLSTPVRAPAAKHDPAAAPASTARTSFTLDLHPTAPCWVSLTIDGRRIVSRLMQAGEHETHVVRKNAVIEIGNAGVFAYSIDGRPGRALGTAGQVRTARITPATAASYLE